jgi:hypothetical protein
LLYHELSVKLRDGDLSSEVTNAAEKPQTIEKMNPEWSTMSPRQALKQFAARLLQPADNLVVNAMHGGGQVLVSELGCTVAKLFHPFGYGAPVG